MSKLDNNGAIMVAAIIIGVAIIFASGRYAIGILDTSSLSNATVRVNVTGSGDSFWVDYGSYIGPISNKSVSSQGFILNGTLITSWDQLNGSPDLSGYLRNDGDEATGNYNFSGDVNASSFTLNGTTIDDWSDIAGDSGLWESENGQTKLKSSEEINLTDNVVLDNANITNQNASSIIFFEGSILVVEG